jgi:hypothetical protein
VPGRDVDDPEQVEHRAAPAGREVLEPVDQVLVEVQRGPDRRGQERQPRRRRAQQRCAPEPVRLRRKAHDRGPRAGHRRAEEVGDRQEQA